MNSKDRERSQKLKEKRFTTTAEGEAYIAGAERTMLAAAEVYYTPEGRAAMSRIADRTLAMPTEKLEELRENKPSTYQSWLKQREDALTLFPEKLIDWAERDEEIKRHMQEFGSSPRFLSLVLEARGHISFNAVYRATRHSPVRKYLGDFTVQPYEKPFWQPGESGEIVRIGDADLSEIRTNFYIEQGFMDFSLDPMGYLEKLAVLATQTPEDSPMRQVWEEVFAFYDDVHTAEFPRLKPQLTDEHGQPRRDVHGYDVPLPAAHQKAAIIKAAREGSLGVFDETGSGKTTIGIGFTEYIGAERPLIICPAGVKDMWEQAIGMHYTETPSISKVQGGNMRTYNPEAKYTIVSYEALAGTEGEQALDGDRLLTALLEDGHDALICDEAHNVIDAPRRRDAILSLTRKIDRKLIMTATPVRNKAEDIEKIRDLIDPTETDIPEFLAKKTIRRQTKDLVELAPFCPETDGEIDFQEVTLNPTQQAVYDTIFENDALDQFTKLRLLRLSTVDHNLIRGGKYKVAFDPEEAKKDLQQAFRSWQRQQSTGKDIPFDSNFLVQRGFKPLFTGVHFTYRYGMDEFIQQFGDSEMQENWQGVAESTKFTVIRKQITDNLARGEKTLISTRFVTGVTREIVDEETDEAIVDDLYSFLSREFPDIYVSRLDGRTSTRSKQGQISEREAVRSSWHTDPINAIMLKGSQAGSVGINLTVDDEYTTGVRFICLDLQDTWSNVWQDISRVYRMGQPTPVHVSVLEAKNTVDVGTRELIMKKKDIQDGILDGMSPDEIERQLLGGKRDEAVLAPYLISPKKEMERRLFTMKGRGAIANEEYIAMVTEDGRTVGEIIAELYVKYWEYTYSGHTARLVRQVIDELQIKSGRQFDAIADLGSGTLILDRILRQESQVNEEPNVYSVDINGHMLYEGMQEMKRLGYSVDTSRLIRARMSETTLPDASCDAVVTSLSFQYSNSADDRGAIATEENRILKDGGHMIKTIPFGHIAPDKFDAFCEIWKDFGIQPLSEYSGRAVAVDHKDVPYDVWLFVGKKVGSPVRSDFPLDTFSFNFESPKVNRFIEGKQASQPVEPKTDGERLVRHEKFAILDPKNAQPRGTPGAVLSGVDLTVTEATARRWGWHVETKERKDGTTQVIFKKN